MFLKKFEASTFDQVMTQIKSEGGEDALIVSTQEKRMGWFGKRSIEVTAALPQRNKNMVEEERDSNSSDRLENIFPHRRYEFRKEESDSDGKEVVKDSENMTTARHSLGRFDQYKRSFLEAGFSALSAAEMSRKLVFDYSRRELDSRSVFEEKKVEMIQGYLKTLSPDIFRSEPSWMVVGPAGVGKTSLIIKLALYLKRTGRAVSLYCNDQRKVLGKMEIAAYAKLIGVPFYAQEPTKKSESSIQLFDGPSLPLGREDRRHLSGGWDGKRSVLLVLDATSRLCELEKTFRWAEFFQPKAVAFTRLDIATQYGVIFDTLVHAKRPLMGASLGCSFKKPFKFFEADELANFIIRNRGVS